MSVLHRSLLILTIGISLIGCAKIGASTVALSAEVGDRINEMEELHLRSVRKYFELERSKIELFLNENWNPLFLKNFLGTSGIISDLQDPLFLNEEEIANLQEVVKSYLVDPSEADDLVNKLLNDLNPSRQAEINIVRQVMAEFIEESTLEKSVTHVASLLGSEDPAQLILEFAEAAHEQMDLQRKEMLEPLMVAEQELEAELSAAYSEILQGQSIITGRLEAARKVSDEQDKLLESVGLSDLTGTVRSKLSKVSEVVGDAISKAEGLIPTGDLLDDATSMEDTIKKTLQSILDK